MNEEQTYPATENPQTIHQSGEKLKTSTDLVEHIWQYAHERPEVIAVWCLGIGFVLGWKLKPW